MFKKLAFILVVMGLLAFAGPAIAAPPFGANIIMTYDGYLDQTIIVGPWVLADTLIVVTNTNKPGKNLAAWIEVFDKSGNLVAEGKFYNGGVQITTIPANGFGWITLGMIVPRPTLDPWGYAGGEKFVIKISTDKGQQYNPGPPIVEIKQVIYKTREEHPGELIWKPGNIQTWAETVLGGKLTPGVVRYPKNIWP